MKWEFLPLATTMLLALFAGWLDSQSPARFPRLKVVVAFFIGSLLLLQYHAGWPLWHDPTFFDMAFVCFILVGSAYLTGIACDRIPAILKHRRTPAQ